MRTTKGDDGGFTEMLWGRSAGDPEATVDDNGDEAESISEDEETDGTQGDEHLQQPCNQAFT